MWLKQYGKDNLPFEYKSRVQQPILHKTNVDSFVMGDNSRKDALALHHTLIHLEAIDLRKAATHLANHEINLLTCSWGLALRNTQISKPEQRKVKEQTSMRADGNAVESVPQLPTKLMNFHTYLGSAEYNGYHSDSAERFVRGWNEVLVTDGPVGNFQMATDPGDADALVYHAYGDSDDIRKDIARANARGSSGISQPPVVFMLTNDGNFIPDVCHRRLLFFVVNVRYDTNCEVYQIPNQEGAAMSTAPTLVEIHERIFGITEQVGGIAGVFTCGSTSFYSIT